MSVANRLTAGPGRRKIEDTLRLHTQNHILRNRVVVAHAVVLAGLLSLALPAAAGAATVTVTSALDQSSGAPPDGTCTLREAIAATNLNLDIDTCDHDGLTGADTIVFNAGLGDIVLTRAGSGEDGNGTGDLDVNTGAGGLTIDGGAGQTVDAGALDRVMELRTGAGLLTLEEITLTGGSGTQGGGLLISAVGGQVELEDSAVNENTATSSAGGISVGGGTNAILTLDTTEVRDNTVTGASGQGGGIISSSNTTLNATDGSIIAENEVTGGTAGVGGGISGTGTINVSDSLIFDNVVTGSGGGISMSGGALTVTGSNIVDNTAQRLATTGDQGGGGIQAADGTISIDDSVIAFNSTGVTQSAPGGGININGTAVPVITDSLIADNDATRSGGGITLQFQSGLTLRRSIVSGNEVSDPTADGAAGGGIHETGSGAVLIEDTLVSGNSTTATDLADTNEGGGVRLTGTNVDVVRTTFSSNTLIGGDQEAAGAHVFGNTSEVDFVNTTFSGNTAPGAGGDGGGLGMSNFADVSLSNSTFRGNDAADQGDGILKPPNSTITLRSTIVDDGCSAAVTDVGGGNFQTSAVTGSCGLTTGAAGFVGGLQNNGGPPIGPPSELSPRLTQAIGFAGSAIDRVAGDCVDHTGGVILEDSRGIPRPFDTSGPGPAGCDSGAFEAVTCAGLLVDGTDAITGTSTGETLTGTPGADQIYAASGDDTVVGGDAADTICGAEGDDDLQGQGGGDRLSGGPGADDMDGGANDDFADYLETPNGVTANLGTGQAGGEGADTLALIEHLQGSRFDDVLTGGPTLNTISAGTASSVDDDVLSGGAGSGPDGNDTLLGGSDPGSIDTVTYAGRTDAVTLNLDTDSGGATAGGEADALNGIENAVGGSGADSVIGDAGPNSLTGGPGVDDIDASAGADELFIRDGVADTADCGADNPGDVDSVEADVQGTDTLTNCLAPDLLDFALAPPNPDPGTGNPAVTPTKPKCKKGRKLKKVKGKFRCVKRKPKRRL
jgi:CSLREA domain-containing protein